MYSAGFSTVYDNGTSAEPFTFKIKVIEGGSIAKYRVVKESDLNKSTGAVTPTSAFEVSYLSGSEWGTADNSSSKINKDETATFTIKPRSDLAVGRYSEDYIVITDRSSYYDETAGTQETAVARFTLTCVIEHQSDGILHYSDKTEHYNLCVNCQAEINKTAHTFDVRTVSDDTFAKPASCTKPAEYFYSCACGAYTDDTALVFENGAPSGHTYGEWQEIKAASCEEGGKEKHICDVCNAFEERDTNPLGHSWNDDFTVDTKPTCTEPGSKSIHCDRCDAKKDIKAIEPNAHSFGEWITVTPAGCLTSGSDKRVCSVCGYEETREIEPTGHIWEDDFTIDIEPACTEKGSKSIHCSKCDEVKDITEVPENGHSFGEWIILSLTDCTQGGVGQHVCTICNFTEINVVPPQEHLWNDDFTVDIAPTCTQSGSKSIHCTKCNAQKEIQSVPAKGHDWSEWKIIKKSTTTENGIKERQCYVCGKVEKNELDLIGDDNSDPSDSKPELPDSKPETPDSKPESPDSKPESPDSKPETPDSKPESPDSKPESPDSKPETPDSKPESPDSKPESPDSKPETPDSKPENSGTDTSEWSSDESHHWHIDSNGNRIDYAYHEFVWITDNEPSGTQPGIGHYVCMHAITPHHRRNSTKTVPKQAVNRLHCGSRRRLSQAVSHR